MSSSLGVAILAAGSSRRMGRPKLLLPWGKTSILGHQIDLWKELGAAQVSVVHAAGDEIIRSELDRVSLAKENRIPNKHPETGMLGSIRRAAAWSGWMPALTHWAIVLGDQPHLQPETLRAVIALSKREPDKICQPRYAGHLKHPVIIPARFFRQLENTKTATLKDFLGSQELVSSDANDPGLDLDIDTPADYEKALRLLGLFRR